METKSAYSTHSPLSMHTHTKSQAHNTHTPARKVSCTKAVILLCGPDVKSFNAKADDEPSQRPNQSATGRRGQEQFVSVRWCWWAKVIVGNINTKSVYDMKNVDSNCRIATLQGAGSARARVIAKESMPPAHIHIESERRRQADTQAHIRFHIVACLIALGARFCCSFYRCCWLWWKIWLCPLCECLAVKIIITHTTPDTRTHSHTHTYWLPPRWLSYLARFIFGNVFHDFVLDFIGSSCLVRPALAAGEKEELCCCFPLQRPLSLSLSRSIDESSLSASALSYVCFIIARKIRESRYNTNSNTNHNNESNNCSQTVDL